MNKLLTISSAFLLFTGIALELNAFVHRERFRHAQGQYAGGDCSICVKDDNAICPEEHTSYHADGSVYWIGSPTCEWNDAWFPNVYYEPEFGAKKVDRDDAGPQAYKEEDPDGVKLGFVFKPCNPTEVRRCIKMLSPASPGGWRAYWIKSTNIDVPSFPDDCVPIGICNPGT